MGFNYAREKGKFDEKWKKLEKNTVDLNLNQNIKMDSNVLNLTEFRWNPFESTIYGMYHGTVYIDSDYYLIGTDDQGNKICYQETSSCFTVSTQLKLKLGKN